MMETTNRLPSISAIFIILGFLLMVQSCAHFGYELRKKPSEEQLANNKRVEEALLQSVYRLLSLDPMLSPDVYEKARAEFDSLLTQYLLSDPNNGQELISIHRAGTTILLPLQVADTVAGRIIEVDRERSRTLWESIGPQFRGEILDMMIHPDDTTGSASLYILFADSLVLVELNGNRNEMIEVNRFTDGINYTVRSLLPSGQFLPQYGTARVQPFFITGRTGKITGVSGFYQGYSNHPSPNDSTPTDMLLDLRSLPGTSLFESDFFPDTGIRSVRPIGSGGTTVILDADGYLKLYRTDIAQPIWQSERPWGNRLFYMGIDTIAVCYSGEKSFVVFTLDEDEFVLLGQSPNFDGTIAAVHPFLRDGESGLLVALSYPNTEEQRTSRLQFIPFGQFEYNSSVIYDIPRFPDYQLQMFYVKSRDDFRSTLHIFRTLPETVFNNVYETLFRLDPDGIPVPQLAAGVRSDSTRRIWEIGLRTDVVFTDGTALSAEAVIEGLMNNKKICTHPECPVTWIWDIILPDTPPGDDILAGESGIFATAQDSLLVILDESVYNLPELLSHPCFHIQKLNEDHAWPLGTGPFRLVEASTRGMPQTIQIDRNDKYRFGMPPVKEIRFIIGRQEVLEFTTENRRVITTMRRRKDINYFREHPQHRVAEFPAQNVYFLAFNPTSTGLSTLGARKRITTLVDRNVLANIVNEAEAIPVGQFTGGLPYDPMPVETEGSGKITQPLRIYYYDRDQVAQQIAERLGALLAQTGIPFRRPEGLTATLLDRTRRNGRYDIIVDSFEPHFRTHSYIIRHLLSRGYRLDAEVDLRHHIDTEKATSAELRKLERTLIEQVYLYPILRTRNFAVLPYELSGMKISGHEFIDMSRSWLPR
jgi:MarR-like DNA-binding transcriptional regulator SgrR of sgrS sRNA